MTFAVNKENKEYSKSAIKGPRSSAKSSPKLTKTSKRHGRHCCGIPVIRCYTQCNVSSIYLEQTFVCTFDVQLIFKNARRNKKVYTKCKPEKSPEEDSVTHMRS